MSEVRPSSLCNSDSATTENLYPSRPLSPSFLSHLPTSVLPILTRSCAHFYQNDLQSPDVQSYGNTADRKEGGLARNSRPWKDSTRSRAPQTLTWWSTYFHTGPMFSISGFSHYRNRNESISAHADLRYFLEQQPAEAPRALFTSHLTLKSAAITGGSPQRT